MSNLNTQHCPLEVNEIPIGWELVSLSQIVLDFQTGFSSGRHNSDGNGVPHLRPMNISPAGTLDLSDLRYVDPQVNQLRLNRSDVLFNNTNSPAWVGKTALVSLEVDLAFSNHMTRLRLPKGINPQFVAEQLHFLCRSGYFQHHCIKHVNQASISRRFLAESTPFLLPPSDEQLRIVAKIAAFRELTQNLREIIFSIGPILDQICESILLSAFEGRLIAGQREPIGDSESIISILESIRQERERQNPESDKDILSIPPREPTSESQTLPDGWAWVQVADVAEQNRHSLAIGPFGSNLKAKDYTARGVPLVFVREIRSERFHDENTKFISKTKASELSAHKVSGGDLLITKMGSPPGDTAVYPEHLPDAVITADCIRLAPEKRLTSSAFLKHWFRTSYFQAKVLEETKGVAQRKLSLRRFRRITFPLPPLSVQGEILRRVEGAFEEIREIRDTQSKLEIEIDRLELSVLAKAFRGELAPQNPESKPASALLTSISSILSDESRKRSKMAKRRRASTSREDVNEKLRKWISKIDASPFTFEDIASGLQLDYEILKGEVFSLLDEHQVLEQFFDKETETIRLRKLMK